MLTFQIEHLILLLRAQRRANPRHRGANLSRQVVSSKLIRVHTVIELDGIEPAIVTLLDGEPLRDLLEKALLLGGRRVVRAWVCSCHSVLKMEQRLLLLLLMMLRRGLAHLVRRVCLSCLSAIDCGRTGAAPDVVPFIVRAFRRLLQLLHRGVWLVIAHCQVAEDIVFCFISCGIPTRVALQSQTIQCRILVASRASSAMFACCRARAWLCAV